MPDSSSSYPPDQPQSPRVRRRHRRWLPSLLATVGVAVAAILIGGTLYTVSIDSAVNQNLQRPAPLPPERPAAKGEQPRPQKAQPAQGEEALNYVLMGSDSRVAGQAGAGRSDVLMVLHLTGDRRHAYLISFPRDMYVPIPGRGRNKINAAFGYGGPQLTVRTLEGMLMRGEQALAYVRERKQLPRGDLDRAERQRAVLQAILAKGLGPDTLTHPRKFLAFSRGVAQHVIVDSTLTDDVLRKTALSLPLTPGDITSLQAPISGFGTTADGQSIDVVDQKKLNGLAQALQDDTMAEYVSRYPNG